MSAPAGWQKGSFRGLAFITEGHDGSGGRRLAIHEFPQSDDAVIEDLGRKAKRFSLSCHIRGADYLVRANAFEDALDAPGDGTLIHPWRGTMRVAVDDFSRTDSTTDGGVASFTVQFVKSGLLAAPQGSPDTRALATTAAGTSAVAAKTGFAGTFNVERVTGFVSAAANGLVDKLVRLTSLKAALLGGSGAKLSAFQSIASALGYGDIVRQPIDLAAATIDLVRAVAYIGDGAAGQIDALRDLLSFGDDLPPVIGDTPARAAQRANQAAFVQLVNLAAAGELVAAIADMDFGAYQDAVELRDGVSALLDARALRQADLGDDAGAAAFDDLRRAMVTRFAAQIGTLVRLQDYVPPITQPAIVIAHRLYGASGVEARAVEIVARNGVQHPGFVAGGRRLRVLTPALAVANG